MHFNFLKKYYFISKFNHDHIKKLDKSISIIYRNYSSNPDEKLILQINNFCKKNGRKFFISNNFKLALKLNLDGVYLPSFNKEMRSNCYTLKKKFKIIGSAHSLKEILIKQKQGAEEIFVSSLFKKNNNFLGLNKFNNLIKHSKIQKIALGGINKENIKILRLLNISGFAGISYFDKKKGP
tara:strand:- start:2213 stop:2755 length:543 start_codon:yes stop_codon:yes gene_type:complete